MNVQLIVKQEESPNTELVNKGELLFSCLVQSLHIFSQIKNFFVLSFNDAHMALVVISSSFHCDLCCVSSQGYH